MHQYQYQTREVNTPYKYILPVFTGAKYKCEIQMYEINANDHHGPLHSVICSVMSRICLIRLHFGIFMSTHVNSC